MEIPFHKPYITEDEVTMVINTLRTGWITMGPTTIEFEERFKEYIGARNAISMNSCTACLHLALRAINLQEADEVIIPAITFAATAEVITYFRAKPVFVDVEKETCNIDLSKIEEKITNKTKVIIPVHYAGQPCDMDEILDIAKKHNLFVIEDAAHAIPAWYKKKRIGTIGDLTCFSFYATKTLTTGEGGMLTTENNEWAEKIKILRLHGISKDAWKRYTNEGSWYYEVVDAGFKYNMTDIQAALGIAQLKKVDWMWERREMISERYSEAFNSMPEVIPPHVKTDRKSAWHLYVLKLNLEMLKIGRNQFIEELRNRGITASVHFIPLYRHPYYKNMFGYNLSEFANSEWIYERIISLPIYPGMTSDNMEYVIEAVQDIILKNRR
ncbi:MAG: DegT/DnrJ/EryC1/StrS family aminotransferase [Thermodesulfovibrionales bacterium]